MVSTLKKVVNKKLKTFKFCENHFFNLLLFNQKPKHVVRRIPRVNVTNTFDQSANAPVQRVCLNQFHKQNFAHIYQYTQLDVTPNFYALRSAPYVSKLSVILQAQKLLIE